MTVTDRRLSILAVLAGIFLLATVLLYSVERKPAVSAQKGATLVQGLDLDKVAKVTIAKKDKTVTLEKKDAGYTVAERKNYPASVKKVNELFIDILGVRVADQVTASAANHAELGVAKGGEEATAVAFADKDGKPLTGVLIGKSASRGGGNYVRMADRDVVYTSEKGLWPSADISGYLDSEIVDVKKDDVTRVAIALPDERYDVTRDKDKKFVLSAVPEGKKQKDWDVESAFDALSSCSFSDVVTAEPAGLKLDATYVCETKNHQTYTVRLGKAGDKHYARFACQGPSRDEFERARMIKKDDPEEKLKEKDQVLTAADKAAKFNERHSPWLYELSSWKAEKMRKPVKDLVEDKPKDAVPEEIAASHVLVAYKGAERADAKIARSKDDAKKRAGELLLKVKAPGADFADVAKKESDCPSKNKGGDLGTFKKGTMHKDFDEAAWKLKVGDLSDVVETPFGFHVIKRTK